MLALQVRLRRKPADSTVQQLILCKRQASEAFWLQLLLGKE